MAFRGAPVSASAGAVTGAGLAALLSGGDGGLGAGHVDASRSDLQHRNQHLFACTASSCSRNKTCHHAHCVSRGAA